MRRRTRIYLLFVLIGLPLIAGGVFISFRSYILNQIIENAQQKFTDRYKGELVIAKAHFSGLTEVTISSVVILPPDRDTLLKISSISVTPNLLQAIKGKIAFNSIFINGVAIKLNKNGKSDNFSFLLNTKDEKRTHTTVSWSSLLYKEFRLMEQVIPDVFEAMAITISATINGVAEEFNISRCNRNQSEFSALVSTSFNKDIPVKGIINKSNTYSIQINSSRKIVVPFVQHFTGSFLSLYGGSLIISEKNADELNETIEISSEVTGLTIYHPKLSYDTIGILNASFKGDILFKGNSIRLDSTSYCKVNSIKATIGAHYRKLPTKLVELKISTPSINSITFFESLPQGCFQNLAGIRTTGNVQYKMRCSINIDLPEDSVLFSSSLIPTDFRILAYGKTNLARINETFEHTSFEKDTPVKTFLVGKENPDFYELQAISHYIRDAILTSEDGSFFWHKGFNEEAIVKSIRENIKAGKFVRGASTISMQLVKNVFLTRKKTLSRKLEEMLIVWLIENQRVVSKERMLEVYLNIIEFGPGIYGIGPACKFYFGKRPSDISLEEAIFISSILPRPKWFMYNFEPNGKVKPFIADYYQAVARFLKGKKLITENEFNDLRTEVDLSGPARSLLKNRKDSVIADSLLIPAMQTKDD